MCNIIDVETKDNLQYIFYPVSSTAVRFRVKAINDAHVALTCGNYESDPMTEILIGGWDNSKSIVRRNRREPNKVKVETPQILNENEYVGMWIRWHNRCIAAGLEGSEEPFIMYDDPSPHPIDHVAVRTGWGSTGSWQIEVSPVVFRPLSLKQLPNTNDLHWVRMTSDDKIPSEAVIGGFEGEILYVARAMHNTSMCPGKYVPSLKCAFIPWEHRVHKKNTFEILCGYNFTWVTTYRDCVPRHAFIGGTATETHSSRLYIGRAMIGTSLIPGKVHLHYKSCHLPFGDEEREVETYDILVVPDELVQKLTWKPPRLRRLSNPDY